MTQTSAAVGLIEAAHDGQGDLLAWCQRLLASAQQLLSPHANLGIVRRFEHRYETVMGAGTAEQIDYWAREARRIPATAVDCLWRYPGYVGTSSMLVAPDGPDPYLRTFHELFGSRDILGIVALVDNVSLSIGLPEPQLIKLTACDRQLLTRVALHLEAGLRLRLEPGAQIAVLHPDGRLLHAEGAVTRRAGAREHLRRHVGAVERSRTRRQRGNVAAVEAWSALISGGWCLVEREEAGGARHYAVLETARARHLRALSELETHAVELSARGLPGKTAAYALGVTGTVISKSLASAALKLGIGDRTKTVQLIAQLLGTGPVREAEGRLTRSECHVLGLVRLGWTNSAIARARARSERTVANQVASLLRKLNVPSRRALATSLAPRPARGG